MDKGQKFIMKNDYHFGRNGGFKKDDIIEYVGRKRSSSGMFSVFKNQDEIILKTYEIWVNKFLQNYTNIV